MNKSKNKEINDLYEAVLKLESVDECRRFLRDLLTENEIKEFSERWKVAQLLAKGVPYSRIEEETGLSSRTIARVGRWLKRGKGGYTLVLKKTAK
jgi:TrpR-related protein YerC/YecD